MFDNQVGKIATDKEAAALLAGDKTGAAYWKEGGIARIAAHSIVGGVLSEAMGKDFATGAIAAGSSQALAAELNQVFGNEGQGREAMSQIVGIVAAGLAGKDVETASFIALQADKFNRQMHPIERALIEAQAKELARETGMSEAEASRLLGAALLYHVDAKWRETLDRAGLKFDDTVLQHLGSALAPVGDFYDVAARYDDSDVPVLARDVVTKNYSASETLRLLSTYENTHSEAYNDFLFNAEYLSLLGGGENREFYRKNLNFDDTSVFEKGFWKVVGGELGKGDFLIGAGEGIYQLGSALINDVEGTANAISRVPYEAAKDPASVFGAMYDGAVDYEASMFLYRLQGNHEAAERLFSEKQAEIALGAVPIGRLGGAAKGVGKATPATNTAEGANGRIFSGEENNHIGAAWDPPTTTLWNPSAKSENCIACVASYTTDRLSGRAGEFMTADDVERIYASVDPSRGLQLGDAISIIHKASRSDTPPVVTSPFLPDAPAGQYALFFGPSKEKLRHVVHAEVLPNGGGVNMFDPQNGQKISVDELTSLRIRWGGSHASPVVPVLIREVSSD